MHESGKKLLSLMFKPGETVCVSPNQFGYHSIPLENVLSDSVTLVPTPESAEKRKMKWEDTFETCETDKLLLVSLNPIKGWRQDMNVTSYRSFLVELDYGPLQQQVEYVKNIGLPYSAMVFSGGKSIHTLITLDRDLPSYEVYYHMAEWILNAATMADPNTKNPSRSIRIPGAEREPGKRQALVEIKGPVKLEDLAAWLRLHPEAKPEEQAERERLEGYSPVVSFEKMKPWVKQRLINGFDPGQGRNKQWFAIACEFALAGYSEEDTIDILRDFFRPDRDFREREWKVTIKSAFKYIYERS